MEKKGVLMLVIALILVAILVFVGYAFYKYFKTSEKQISLGESIENFIISEDGKTAYIKLKEGSYENITQVRFIFQDIEEEYIYETTERKGEIEVLFRKSFWDWFFGRRYRGKYDYEIPTNKIGTESFRNMKNVDVIFVYKTEKETFEAPILDTEMPISSDEEDDELYSGNEGDGGGDGGGTGASCIPTCQEGYNCESGKCVKAIECLNNNDCNEGYNCVNNKCEFNCIAGENCFYVSVSGAGSHDGSLGSEFNLTEARNYSKSNIDKEIMFLLESGNYGRYWEAVTSNAGGVEIETISINRNKWHTFKAKEINNKPVFISIKFYQPSTRINSYLIFDGINVRVPMPSQPAEPPWNMTSYPLSIRGANYIHVKNSELKGADKYLTGLGVFIEDSDNIIISNSEISTVVGGIMVTGTYKNLAFINDNVNNLSKGSGISLMGNSENTLIEGIHLHGLSFNQSDFYFPPDKLYLNSSVFPQESPPALQIGEEIWQTNEIYGLTKGKVMSVKWESSGSACENPSGKCYVVYVRMITRSETMMVGIESTAQTSGVKFTPVSRGGGHHIGSAVAIRISNITIRNNVMHDFSGQGIYTYSDSVPNENIIFENNLFYDIGNGNGFVEINGKLVIRNNTFVGYISDYDLDADSILYRYTGSPFSVSFWPGFDGTGVEVYNNIVVGPYALPDPANEFWRYKEDYNLWWSRGGTSGFNTTRGEHSLILVWKDSGRKLHGWPNFYEDTGFREATNEYGYNRDGILLFFVNANFTRDIGTGVSRTLDYHPLMSSKVCDGSMPGSTPRVAWAGALLCVGEIEVSSLSPFAKTWNFLKSLLTKKTARAITGNVVKNNTGV